MLGTEWQDFGSYRLRYGAGDITFTVSARLIGQDIANNRSLVQREWWYVVNNGGYIQSYNTQHYLTGIGWTDAAYWDSGTSSNYVVLLDKQEWISHNDDGTGSFSCWGATWCGGIGVETGWVGQDNITLPTIARASLPSVSPNPIILSQTNNELTVNTNPKADSFIHELFIELGSYSEQKTAIADSTTFSIPKTVLASFADNSTTLEGSVTCNTYKDSITQSNYIGQRQVLFTAQIDVSQEHPSITSVTLTDTNLNSAAIEAQGSYIKYATNLSASIALGVTGSYTELASAVVQCGTKQQTYALSGTSQTIVFTYEKLDADALIVTVYDKRGTVATQTKTWTLIPYRDITVTGSVDRISETGNTISFSLSGACFGGSFGNATNAVTVSYKYKLHNASTWTDGSQTFTFTPSGSGETTYEYTNTISGFDYDKQYELRFTVTDLFTTATTRDLGLTTGIPVWGHGPDFFAIYGNLFLHDRESPNNYWTLSSARNLVSELDALKMNVYSDTQNSSSTTSDFNATFQKTVNGTGFLIVSVSCISDTYNSYGSQSAKVYLNNTVISASASRCPSNATAELGESAVACIAVNNGDVVKATASITKYGTRKAYFSCLAIGCTLN